MKCWFEIGGKKIEYSLTKSRRSTIGISISLDEGMRVLAPNWASREQIDAVLFKKSSWILNKASAFEELKAGLKPREYVSGEHLLYLGKEYPIEVHLSPLSNSIEMNFDGKSFKISKPDGISNDIYKKIINEALVKWYRTNTSRVVNERMEFFSRIIGVTPLKIVIKQQKRRWGSCSGKNIININWKIIMAPPEVIDYLVVHELSHIKHKNHSKDFWGLVGTIMPDYKVRDQWLKENALKLTL